MFKNRKPLKRKVFTYLIVLILLILLLLWLFQVTFLNHNYESYKTKELENALVSIKKSYSDDTQNLYDVLEKFSYDKGICSEITINGKLSYTTNPMNRGCLNVIDMQNSITQEKYNFLNGTESEMRLRIINKRLTNKTLVYGLKLDDKTAIFINTSIDPIDSTVTILQNQLIVITCILVILAVIAAYFISNKLSKPLTILTKKSKELSENNFEVDFNVDTDVTEIKELANSLNYTKDVLKKNDDLRRDLLANVSHDLKTPLTMIKAYAEMVRDLSYKDKEKRENDLNVIIEEVDRLNLLVNDILNLSKLESNIENVKNEDFDLIEVIETIINRFKIFSITEDFTFICHYPRSLIINGDKQKIEQVIYNLIGNAINYSKEKHKIYVTIIDKKNIRVNITDLGSGIDQDEIDKIWNKYYKTDKKYKRSTVGTGLGLSIVKHILDLHKFTYGVISKKKLGTTFYFIINKKS